MNEDRRRLPARGDIAAVHLRGKVAAERFVAGRGFHVSVGWVPLLRVPDAAAPIDTELLFGETFHAYEVRNGWAWGQAESDGYVGYVREDALMAPAAAPTHMISVPRSFLLAEPKVTARMRHCVSMNSLLTVTGQQDMFCAVSSSGWIHKDHIVPIEQHAPDFVAVAALFLGVPYLWGGRTSLGIDCSGLVQIAMQRAGLACPRDSDMQAAEIGTPRPAAAEGLQRGDLVFWRGHVGIMMDSENLLHANAHHMCVASEPLSQAATRIAAGEGGKIIAVRRPDTLCRE